MWSHDLKDTLVLVGWVGIWTTLVYLMPLSGI